MPTDGGDKDIRSVVSHATGEVIQARDVLGGIHLHQAERGHVVVPRQLPAAVGDFTGRDSDLARLNALLGDSAFRPEALVISAVHGMPGVGKTALAVYWAHLVQPRFPDGTLYADLRGYGPAKPAEAAEVLESFLTALGVPAARFPQGLDAQAALYRSLLAERRVLVLLDNARDAGQVRPLLPGSGTCLALITSRSRLGGLVSGQGAQRVSLTLLPEDQAIDLLRVIIGPARVDAEPLEVARIARACDFLPLALRLAGQTAATRMDLSMADIAAELDAQRDPLAAFSDPDDESISLPSVFGWSYRCLDEEQRRVFRLLGLHPSTEFGLYAVAALADLPLDETRDLLNALADLHLIEYAGRERYRIHDLVHFYAQRLVTSEEEKQSVRRMLAFYLHAADAADIRSVVRLRVVPDALPEPEQLPSFQTEAQARTWARTESRNLVAAARYAAELHMADVTWQLLRTVAVLLEGIVHRLEWRDLCELGLKGTLTTRDVRGQLHMLVYLCHVHSQLRNHDLAIDFGRRAVSVSEAIQDPDIRAMVLEYLGVAYSEAHLFERAVSNLRAALDICTASDDGWAAAIVMNYLGEIYLRQGRAEEALTYHRRAIEVFRKATDHHRRGWSLRLLGEAHVALGDYEAAARHLTEALLVLGEAEFAEEKARTHECLGNVLEVLGDQEGARRHWAQAFEMFSGLGDPRAGEIRLQLGPD